MGIKGLLPFVRKTHPTLIKEIPARWLSPEIKGKSVAIDGPLLTSRFFFATGGQELEAKRMLVGWHALITTMRKAGVTPITVWDVKGDRIWKRKEHQRRQAIRQLSMSRYLHEERRQERLERFKGLVQGAIAAAQLDDATEQLQEKNSLNHLGANIDSVILEVQLSSRPSSRRRLQLSALSSTAGNLRTLDKGSHETEIAPGILADEESELCLELPLSEDDEQILTEAQDQTEDVEMKRALVEPDGSYTESLRQMALTAEEELLLQDLARSASSDVNNSSRVRDIAKDVEDLQSRARIVAKTYARGHSLPAKWEIEEVQQLLRVMGVPVVLAHSPFEAEGLASAMALAGTVDFVGTEDTDVLAYEAPLLRNIASGNKPIEIIEGKAVRTAYDLTRNQYIDFLILSGTDASSRIKGVGPVKALKWIREFGSIEAILKSDERIRQRVASDYHDEVDAARTVFNDLPPLPRPIDLEPRRVEEKVVRDYMKITHGIILPAEGPNDKEYSIQQRSDQLEEDAELAQEIFMQQCMLEGEC
ncbi:hypothetical protein NliqN6_1958 [Naganishia liquefaciens]|uniref:Exonuclease 1 n=1 Tax=Naganishia liquefaciens TaxID=104408 RepID=A0A8H3YFC5_9TREE|nr:hypothetical protein NliqN6_1958 [Naganishia liquefaciens]